MYPTSWLLSPPSRPPPPRSPCPSLSLSGDASGSGGSSGSAQVHHGSHGSAARRGNGSHQDLYDQSSGYLSLHPSTHPPSPSFASPPELARSPAAAAAAVTTTRPPSCNPTLSAFLFLLQQVCTGCPSRGYGGRQGQLTLPKLLLALSGPAVLSVLATRGAELRWEGLRASSSALGHAC